MYAEYVNEIDLDEDYLYYEQGERFSDIPLPPVMNIILFAGWIVISMIGFAVIFLAKNPVAGAIIVALPTDFRALYFDAGAANRRRYWF